MIPLSGEVNGDPEDAPIYHTPEKYRVGSSSLPGHQSGENLEIELAKKLDKDYVPDLLENGDTRKQLLARSRYLLFKDETGWTPFQQHIVTVISPEQEIDIRQ